MPRRSGTSLPWAPRSSSFPDPHRSAASRSFSPRPLRTHAEPNRWLRIPSQHVERRAGHGRDVVRRQAVRSGSRTQAAQATSRPWRASATGSAVSFATGRCADLQPAGPRPTLTGRCCPADRVRPRSRLRVWGPVQHQSQSPLRHRLCPPPQVLGRHAAGCRRTHARRRTRQSWPRRPILGPRPRRHDEVGAADVCVAGSSPRPGDPWWDQPMRDLPTARSSGPPRTSPWPRAPRAVPLRGVGELACAGASTPHAGRTRRPGSLRTSGVCFHEPVPVADRGPAAWRVVRPGTRHPSECRDRGRGARRSSTSRRVRRRGAGAPC